MGFLSQVAATTALAFAFCAASTPALAGCKLGLIAELPVSMAGTRPMAPAKINGHDVQFMVDSGAFYSTLSPTIASELKLGLSAAPFGLFVDGVGGTASIDVTTVTFTLAKVDIPRVQFLVTAGAGGHESAGLIGQNVLGLSDVEYDLANGVVRLQKPSGCGNTPLAYWAKPEQIGVVDEESNTERNRKAVVIVYVNGKRVRAELDTGAGSTVLFARAAARIGLPSDGPDVTQRSLGGGIGPRALRSWVVPVAEFKIADESIKNTHLRILDTPLSEVDMLLGADFFLSHHIFISHTQEKVYFTYNGGPVFNLTTTPQLLSARGRLAEAGAASAPPPAADPPTPDTAGAAPEAEPTDAEGFSRRGLGYAARTDIPHALADLNRAVDLAPNEPRYVFERARVRLSAHQPILAMNDLDQTLRLNPNNVEALVQRAGLRAAAGDEKGAHADLDTASGLAPREADVRSTLAGLYSTIFDYAAAVGQYDLWIAAHADENAMATALNGRCWARAQLGQDLDKALGDCNRALRMVKTPGFLDSRGLVYLRLGRLDEAIADFDAALAQNPKLAWSLYGRGLARLRKGLKAEGDADIKAALGLRPKLGETARRVGLTPEG